MVRDAHAPAGKLPFLAKSEQCVPPLGTRWSQHKYMLMETHMRERIVTPTCATNDALSSCPRVRALATAAKSRQ